LLIRFHKPFGVLSQFTDREGRRTLADHIDLPDVHVAGRLDLDSEGLMLLTDIGPLQARIAEPRFKLPKRYWVQVEGRPDADELRALDRAVRQGVLLGDGPARALGLREVMAPHPPERDPPVTPHRAARSMWLEITLTEGRNRQVRRMLASLGLPVLRLLRTQIGAITLDGLAPGAWEAIDVPEEWARRAKTGRGTRFSRSSR
jgi:23S rRNA pseudouridine2457 synthase